MMTPPDVCYTKKSHAYRPSWSASDGFVNQEHKRIFAQTENLPGWQAPGDSEKLYEMAYYCGATILEIGVYGGRSATVELLGAKAAQGIRGGPKPQFYGIEIDSNAIQRSLATLSSQELSQDALLYHGDLRQFFYDIPIVPTMVFVDGNHNYPGIWADLDCLGRELASGTPVLCHDYLNPNADVQQAVDEWVARGTFQFMGTSGCSSLLRVANDPARIQPRRLSNPVFDQIRHKLLTKYDHEPKSSAHMDVANLTEPARLELAAASVPQVHCEQEVKPEQRSTSESTVL